MFLFFLHRRGHDVFVAMPFCKDKTELNYTIICSDPDENIMPMIDSITEPILKVIYFQNITTYFPKNLTLIMGQLIAQLLR